MKYETEYMEGFSARRDGKAVVDNPHPPFGAERAAWYRGWRDQDQHLNAWDECLTSIGWFG